jgi:predicted nucleic acid-binding protein
MVCLETTFLIDVLRGDARVKETLDSIQHSTRLVAAPTVMELWSGALQSRLPEKEKAKIEQLLEALTVLPLNEKAAKEAGEIEADLIQKGQMIDVEDIMIGAICIAHGEKLITRDNHYARIDTLKMEKY